MRQAVIQTFSGRGFDLLSPNPAEIRIADIAHSLSLLCRFGGHCKAFYSVAEHCVHVSKLVPLPDAMWGLFHDASEAYCGDMLSPLKPFRPEHGEMEREIQRAVAAAFHLQQPIPASVHLADDAMLATERRQIMERHSDVVWGRGNSKPASVRLSCWSSPVAEWKFMERFYEIRQGLRQDAFNF